MNKIPTIRIITYIVIMYMLAALTWWTILLFQKNQEAYIAKIELLTAQHQTVQPQAEVQQSSEYRAIAKSYNRQNYMIFGESIVFILSLLTGVWLINRAYNREINAANQRRNFLLSITHELKSPIASIRLTLETFLKRALQKEQVDRLSGKALSETERLHKLVNNLLLAARMDATYTPVPETINMQTLIEDNMDSLQQKYPKATISFQTPEETVHILADRLGITTIVLNLLENAIKYSFDNPTIVATLRTNAENVYFKVADQGVGIQDKDKKKIFSRFYRIGNEDTRKTKGTGLGLYIVKEMVKAHQGKIKIEDNQPKGSIFKVVLPKVTKLQAAVS